MGGTPAMKRRRSGRRRRRRRQLVGPMAAAAALSVLLARFGRRCGEAERPPPFAAGFLVPAPLAPFPRFAPPRGPERRAPGLDERGPGVGGGDPPPPGRASFLPVVRREFAVRSAAVSETEAIVDGPAEAPSSSAATSDDPTVGSAAASEPGAIAVGSAEAPSAAASDEATDDPVGVNGGGVDDPTAEDGSGAAAASASASASALPSPSPPGDVGGAAAVAAPDVGDDDDVPTPTENGGYTHTAASRAKISAANRGRVPWNKGRVRSEEVKRRIAEGVRRRNRERFLERLADMGLTEEEYEERRREERRAREAERRARRTERGGYRPTEETKKKISAILKEKWANGEVKKRSPSTGARRSGFRHTEETKQKIRESLRKRWATDPDYRARKEASARRQNSSSDARERIAATLRKKWEDPEFREYMMGRMAQRRRATNVVDDEHRRKISVAMKRKWQDAEYRRRAVEGMRRQVESRGPRPASSRPSRVSSASASSPRRGTGKVPVADGIFAVVPVTPKKKQPKRSKAAKKRRPAGAGGGSAAPKRRKRKKRAPAAVVEGDDGGGAGLTAARPLTASKSDPKGEEEEEEADEGEGSLRRLRRERRDLYDLLYGDDESLFATEAAMFDGQREHPKAKGAGANDLKARAVGGEPERAPSPANAFAWDDEDFDDENLDNFDPYGLDDF